MSAETWRELIGGATRSLGDHTEARWIVEGVAELPRAVLATRLDLAAPPVAVSRVAELVNRRRGGEPLQHVLGYWSFRSLEVAVDRRALIPRPETEIVTDVAIAELDRLMPTRGPTGTRLAVVDLGTGSGVIALSIATERSFAEVTATDRSAAALQLAAENTRRQSPEIQSRISLLSGDWFSPLPASLDGRVAVIVSNPPYLARDEWDQLEAVVRLHDPYEALVAGESGLEAIETIVCGAPEWLCCHGAVVVEIAPHQAEAVGTMAAATTGPAGYPAFESVEVLTDLTGRARVLRART